MGDFIIDFTGEASRAYYAPLIPIVLALWREGLTAAKIGREFERRGTPTFKGQVRWARNQVRRALLRSLRPVVMELHNTGLSHKQIAREMERQGIRMLGGHRRWKVAHVQQIIDFHVDAMPT